MNKTAIKNFAIWARVNLIEAVKQRAYEYEITKDGTNNTSLESVGGRILSTAERDQRRALINKISEKGFDQVMEEAAYTWFNRFIALRFMEVNGYLPARVRVFTNEEGEFKPEIMKEAMTVEIEGLNREKVLDLIDKQNNEELFKYLILTQCNALGNGLPKMFEKIEHWTELLFPANLLRADGVIGKMVTEIPEEDWQDAVQIIGWLYQFYNTEPKAAVFAKNGKVSKEEIPAATQLFTPDWIVRYMVENSLGRLWLEGHPNDEMKAEWKYYLDEAKQEEVVEKQLNKIREEAKSLQPQDIKVIDPCMGSGHILVYAFDVLMQIYLSAGWSERDAAKSIVENNLYGLDIDDRAGQLAYFAVMMKARQYNRRALAGGVAGVVPNVYSIQESNNISRFAVEDFCNGDAKALEEMDKLIRVMRDAKEYGSILNIKDVDFDLLFAKCDAAQDHITISQREIQEDIIPLIKIAYVMTQKYDVAVTNPPYMSIAGSSAKLNEYVKCNYPDSKTDLFAVFIEKCATMLKGNGYQAMITMHSWMFLSSYEKLREKLLNHSIVNMVHLGARAFEEIGGEVVQTTSFVIKSSNVKGFKATYCRLVDPTTQNGKEEKFLSGESRFNADKTNFAQIPGTPIAYWLSKQFIYNFTRGDVLKKDGDTRQGMATSDNNRFLRLWFEVSFNKIGIGCKNAEEAISVRKKWYPYNKGGEYRKWYGNIDYTVNYENDGAEVKGYATSLYKTPSRTIKSISEYFKHALSWSKVSSGNIAFRYYPHGFVFDVAGCCIFYRDDARMFYDFGFLNSVVSKNILTAISPTLNYEAGHIASLPIVKSESDVDSVKQIVADNIDLCKDEWNSFETSWDFKKHPLI